MNKSLREIADILLKAHSVILAGHVMPDGDSVGSTAALGLMLEHLGKRVTLVSNDPIPSTYTFLPGSDKFVIGQVPTGEYDLFVVLDCSVPERTGESLRVLLDKPGPAVLNLDHHASTPPYGDYNYIDPKASAVGEIVFDLGELLGVPLSLDIATCLYTAISTDTGSFRYDNTTAGTHRRVARLIECGLSPSEVSTLIYDEKPLSSLRLLHAVLGTLKVSPCGTVAWMRMTRRMEREAGATDDEAEGLINYARVIEGVEIALFFRETGPDRYKVGFRSKRAVDVSKLAQLFGGGGHPRASGCSVEGPYEEVEQRLVDAAVAAAREGLHGRYSKYPKTPGDDLT